MALSHVKQHPWPLCTRCRLLQVVTVEDVSIVGGGGHCLILSLPSNPLGESLPPIKQTAWTTARVANRFHPQNHLQSVSDRQEHVIEKNSEAPFVFSRKDYDDQLAMSTWAQDGKAPDYQLFLDSMFSPVLSRPLSVF